MTIVERKRGWAGQQQRARRLKRTDGLCERCLELDRVTMAVVVNHIKPLIHGGSDDDDNTENLCREHDLKATADQFKHRVRSDGRGIGRSGRPTSVDHPWNRRA